MENKKRDNENNMAQDSRRRVKQHQLAGAQQKRPQRTGCNGEILLPPFAPVGATGMM